MGNYHPIINIDINKSYIIRAYNDKPAEYVADKVRELSEDKTGWSNKVMFAVSKIIHCNGYNLPDDLFIVLNNSTKTMNISLDKPMQDYKRDELIEKMRATLDKLPDDEDDTAASIYEVYLGLNGKYQVFDDITMAQLILLLSELSKESKKLWITITFRLKEIKDAIFHISNENGKVRLSERAYPNLSKEDIMRLHSKIIPYIDSMNELIDGTRSLPK
jgi:hypothetical protein|nr:MAG TPA: hypothetical protein [Caudoviricetes sp.]